MPTIPATIEEAQRELVNLDGLITARSWQRAAIVYAFTEKRGSGSHNKVQNLKSEVLSAEQFAGLGINGLASPQTVRAYHGHWQYAIDQGKAQPVEPGDTFVEPTGLKFPPNPDSSSGTSRSMKARLADMTPGEQLAAFEELLEVVDSGVVAALAGMAARRQGTGGGGGRGIDSEIDVLAAVRSVRSTIESVIRQLDGVDVSLDDADLDAIDSEINEDHGRLDFLRVLLTTGVGVR